MNYIFSKNNLSTLFLILLLLISSSTSHQNDHPKKDEKIYKSIFNTNLKVEGDIIADSVHAENIQINGELKAHSLDLNNIETEQLISNNIQVDTIMAKKKDIIINGNIILTNEISGDNIDMESRINNGWYLIKHDDFETEQSLQGWSDKRINRCKDDSNTHLGGHCNFAGNKVTKVFSNLPPHKIVRINAFYHMIDYWNGEEGYMLVDGIKKWSKKGKTKANGIDICGGNSKDAEYNIKIDVTVEHQSDSLEISFGSTLTGDPCLHSFAVDDVMIYTKN